MLDRSCRTNTRDTSHESAAIPQRGASRTSQSGRSIYRIRIPYTTSLAPTYIAPNPKQPSDHNYTQLRIVQLPGFLHKKPSLPNMQSTALATSQHFNSLKSQIISLATALYGTRTTPGATFDVLAFSTPRRTPNGTALNQHTHGAALIYYTGPASAPYTSWEMLSYADNQHTVNAGAQQLLDDMQRGVGDVIGMRDAICLTC